MKRIVPPLIFLLAGCSAQAVKQPTVPTSTCRDHFRVLDLAVNRAGVRDHGDAMIPGFPYLRSNRFLASFSTELDDPDRFQAWVRRLAQLDQLSRNYEITALKKHESEQTLTYTNDCRNTLIQTELSSQANRNLLRTRAQVPDDYLTTWRVLGIYPVTALFVKAGIARWHEETRNSYALPLDKIPVLGRLQYWSPPAASRLSTAEVKALLTASITNPLSIPEPSPIQRDQLFASFAPQWVIDTVDDNDLPGSPLYTVSGPVVDTTKPTLYRRLSYTRFQGKVLLQLNYIIWFPARPPAHEGDIYAGAFDGINFRVTLNTDGRPLLFDTIHNCGCYHRFFPVAPLKLNPAAIRFWSEMPLVPQSITSPGQVPLIYLSARTHFVNRLDFAEVSTGRIYRWETYDSLRSLPLPDGNRRSLFGKHGLIEVSKRPERFLLWPMGIRSPGAMRQWGHHPTAFVGRRHFDDPHLIERLFILPGEETRP